MESIIGDAATNSSRGKIS